MKYLLFILCFLIACNDMSGIDDVIVKYIISGTSTNANIEYSLEGQMITLENVSLPWEFEYKLWADERKTYIITLGAEKITGDNSVIDMEILLDGVTSASGTFNGPYETDTIQTKIILYGSD